MADLASADQVATVERMVASARTRRSTSTACRTARARPWPAPQDFTIDTISARLEQSGDLGKKLLSHKDANLLMAIEKLGQ